MTDNQKIIQAAISAPVDVLQLVPLSSEIQPDGTATVRLKDPIRCPPHQWVRQSGSQQTAVTFKCRGICAGIKTVDLAAWDGHLINGTAEHFLKGF